MLIPSLGTLLSSSKTSLSRRVNANSQLRDAIKFQYDKLIKKGEC